MQKRVAATMQSGHSPAHPEPLVLPVAGDVRLDLAPTLPASSPPPAFSQLSCEEAPRSGEVAWRGRRAARVQASHDGDKVALPTRWFGLGLWRVIGQKPGDKCGEPQVSPQQYGANSEFFVQGFSNSQRNDNTFLNGKDKVHMRFRRETMRSRYVAPYNPSLHSRSDVSSLGLNFVSPYCPQRAVGEEKQHHIRD
ncbi:hypothetical protein CIB48_g9421 [Xylaria polymorpha]|nr:hypothetical protein CIB48_g9421 [Xylaria polymorpha]